MEVLPRSALIVETVAKCHPWAALGLLQVQQPDHMLAIVHHVPVPDLHTFGQTR